MDEIRLLSCFLTQGFEDIYDRNHLRILYRIIKYELITCSNSLYMIVITQIVKLSPFFDQEIKGIADEMYNHLLQLIQNARIISVQTNYRYPTNYDHIDNRGKLDNTTRLQILYGYENYDAYYLRLDLAHKGQGFIHYNNKSPGGVKCSLFNESEYKEILSKYPNSDIFFIQYGNRYALREMSNLTLNETEVGEYKEIACLKEHEKAFVKEYSEEKVLEPVDTNKKT